METDVEELEKIGVSHQKLEVYLQDFEGEKWEIEHLDHLISIMKNRVNLYVAREIFHVCLCTLGERRRQNQHFHLVTCLSSKYPPRGE